jgi:type II secretion system protein L
VPSVVGGCALLLDDNLLFVRRASGLPYVLDAEPLQDALEFALGGDEGSAESREHVTFFTGTTEYERHRDAIEGLRARTATMQVKLLADGTLPLLAAQAVSGAGVNLLQGAYAPRSSFGSRLREWRLPAALAATLVLLFVGGQATSWWQLSRAEKALDAQIAEVFAQAMPGQKMIDARAQMEGVLRTQGASAAGLLPALSVLAQAMTQAPSARIEAMSFRGNALELRLTAPTIEALDGIKQAVTRDGISAEIQSATPRGAVVEGRLQVRLGQA